MTAPSTVQTTPAPILILSDDDATAFEAQRAPIAQEASALVIVDQATLEEGGRLLTEVIKPLLKEIANSCDPVCATAHAAHRAATKQRADLQAPLLEAEAILTQKVGAFVTEQKRLYAEEQRRIAHEEAVAEAERQRVEREAEAERQRVERAEAAERQRAEREAMERAAEAEAAGRPEEAEVIVEEAVERAEAPPEPAPIQAPPPLPPPARVAAPAPTQPKGVSVRTHWCCEVVDTTKLLQGVLDGDVPTKAVKIDVGAMNKIIRSLGGEATWPGVKFTEQPVVSNRGR